MQLNMVWHTLAKCQVKFPWNLLAEATLCHRNISQIFLQKKLLKAEKKLHEIDVPVYALHIKIE